MKQSSFVVWKHTTAEVEFGGICLLLVFQKGMMWLRPWILQGALFLPTTRILMMCRLHLTPLLRHQLAFFIAMITPAELDKSTPLFQQKWMHNHTTLNFAPSTMAIWEFGHLIYSTTNLISYRPVFSFRANFSLSFLINLFWFTVKQVDTMLTLWYIYRSIYFFSMQVPFTLLSKITSTVILLFTTNEKYTE